MCAECYLRFETACPAPRTRAATYGLFRPAYAAMDAAALPEWLRGAIREELDWFEMNLAVPRRFGVVTRKSARGHAGVCWFRDDARACIRHANALAALVEEAGVALARVVSQTPGDIVWRDDQQIVAIPRMH
jgi:hypothetical protein